MRYNLIVIGLVLLLSSPSFASECGDIDGNGTISVTDGVLALRCSAGLSIPFPCLPNGDINNDGKVTVTDGVNILRKAAELIEAGGLNTNLTCNIVWDEKLPTTDSWTVVGTNASVRYGANRNFGGVGVELTLTDPNNPESAVNVIEARSGAGAGWQTSYWGRDAVTNLVTIMNQAAGNNVGSQWGYKNSFSGTMETYWNPVTSDKYYPSGNFNDPSVGSSPCNNNGYTFDDGRLSLTFSTRSTFAGNAISIRNEYSLRARANQNYKKWVLAQGPYFDKQVAQNHNLRVYFHGRSGWNEGPIMPWKDFTVTHGEGLCSDTGCAYTISGSEVDYAVAVWKIGGHDIGLAFSVDTSSTIVFYNEKMTYCGDAANPHCGNIALGQYLVYNTTGYQVSAGSERVFGVTYTVGTVDELHALGYYFKVDNK